MAFSSPLRLARKFFFWTMAAQSAADKGVRGGGDGVGGGRLSLKKEEDKKKKRESILTIVRLKQKCVFNNKNDRKQTHKKDRKPSLTVVDVTPLTPHPPSPTSHPHPAFSPRRLVRSCNPLRVWGQLFSSSKF